jgi:hypothetical protein
MGELRAYAVPAWAVRALLGRPENRELVLDMVRAALGEPARPEPLGPIFARVPGGLVVQDDDPGAEDVDRLLSGARVPGGRASATWRLVEAVASEMAASAVRATRARPSGLTPLGLAVPLPDDLVVGSWTPVEAAEQPLAAYWLEPLTNAAPDDLAYDVLVFWSERGGRGPAG